MLLAIGMWVVVSEGMDVGYVDAFGNIAPVMGFILSTRF